MLRRPLWTVAAATVATRCADAYHCHPIGTSGNGSSRTRGGNVLAEQTRCLMHASLPCLLKVQLNPAKQNYSMEHAYEEPTFRFICEGVDIDYKEEVRAALKKVLPPPIKSFTQRQTQMEEGKTSALSPARQTLQLLRALGKAELVTYAQVRSTPARLAAFYEVLATARPSLALVAADHFTFAGLVATHGSPRLQEAILNGVDSAKTLGCLACRELIADEAPLNTEARYDTHDKCFVLRGMGKFAVVGAECADWAVVTATLTLNKNEDNGVHAFVVRLRENGELVKGVTIRPIAAEDTILSEAGTAVLHFDSIDIPQDSLLGPFCITAENKVGYLPGKEAASSAVEVLRTRTRVATGAIHVGVIKQLMTGIVRFVAQKDMLGPDYTRNYPYFGLQHVQTPLVCLVAKFYVYLASWQRLLPVVSDTAGKGPSYEDHMRLAGTVHFLQETTLDLHHFANEFMGVHGTFASTGSNPAMAVAHVRQEGPDMSTLIREVAYKSVTKNIGTSHWGWWATNVLQAFPSLDRLIKNPMYSPRIADLGRHLIFFSHKHYGTKRQLRRSRELERRKGGSEHQWYDWVMFRHRDVLHCGEAFMEMRLLEVMMEETQRCGDPRGRKLLRDMGWIFALARQMDRLDYILMKRC